MQRGIAWALLIVSLTFGAVAHAAPATVVGVVASGQQSPNVALNTVDGKLDTRWAANGDGQWIEYELNPCATVAELLIDWYQGETRVTLFDVETSENGTDWVTAFSGSSDGKTRRYESVKIDHESACFVRIVGHGNTSPVPGAATWVSITEVQIVGEDGDDQLNIAVPLAALQAICAPLLP